MVFTLQPNLTTVKLIPMWDLSHKFFISFYFMEAMPAVVYSMSFLSLDPHCYAFFTQFLQHLQLGQHHTKLLHPLIFIKQNTTVSTFFHLILNEYSFFQMQLYQVLSVLCQHLSISSVFHCSHTMSSIKVKCSIKDFIHGPTFVPKYVSPLLMHMLTT